MESIGGTEGKPGRRRRMNGEDVEGRKGKDKQEAVIETAELKKRMPQLVKLKKAADDAGEDLNDAIKKAAEESGLLATVVRKAVVASAGENFEAKHREVTQLSLAFGALA